MENQDEKYEFHEVSIYLFVEMMKHEFLIDLSEPADAIVINGDWDALILINANSNEEKMKRIDRSKESNFYLDCLDLLFDIEDDNALAWQV